MGLLTPYEISYFQEKDIIDIYDKDGIMTWSLKKSKKNTIIDYLKLKITNLKKGGK
jgi:hypothetical protein